MRYLRGAALGLVMLLTVPVAAESLWVSEGKNGTPMFSSRRPGVAGAREFRPARVRFGRYRGIRSAPVSQLFLSQYGELIEAAARKHGLDRHLVRAVIHTESAFNPRAVSPKGARGLMQLMPATARSLGVRDSFHPAENIGGGVRFLAYLNRKFGGNVRLALAAYNAGEDRVRRYGGIPPYAETRAYVDRVLALRARYAAAGS